MQKVNSNCNSGDAVVGYIYGELNAADRDLFEDHLLDCTACTDEFATIADSRYAVYEWQKLEFEPMPTPRFAIPHAEPSVSWLDVIRGIFATGPRLATAGAFGLLIATLGLAAIMNSAGSTEVVSIDSLEVTDTFSVPVAPTADDTVATVSKPVEPSEDKDNKFRPEFVTVTKPNVEQKRKSRVVRRNNLRPQNVGTDTQAKAPRLNDFEDFSDDSLRLADLVAEVDSKD